MTAAAGLDGWLSAPFATIGRRSRAMCTVPGPRPLGGPVKAHVGSYSLIGFADVTPAEMGTTGRPFLASAWLQLALAQAYGIARPDRGAVLADLDEGMTVQSLQPDFTPQLAGGGASFEHNAQVLVDGLFKTLHPALPGLRPRAPAAQRGSTACRSGSATT